jgi:subtilisin family serine protease
MNGKRLFFSLLIAVILVSFVRPWSNVQAGYVPVVRMLPSLKNKMDESVKSRLSTMSGKDVLTVIVTLREQADLSAVDDGNGKRDVHLKGVLRALQATSDQSQKPMKALLKSRMNQGIVKKYSSFWIFNGFSITATSDVINELAQRPEVYSISSDDIQIVPVAGPAQSNISMVNAPSLWDLGFSGQGVVVANMDSGVDVSHPDLASRWRGGTNSWFDPYGQHSTPTDLTGHGTQTMGIMVGGDASGTSIGMAPGATWIAVKIFPDTGNSTATAIHQGYQWLLDPDGNPDTADAPNVVNNSWAFGNIGCYLDFEPDLLALRNAGILPVFAAGNGGPSSNTSYSPANNPSAFAVGALNINGSSIYGYSSRGPTTCGNSTGPFPELVAPGVSINTTDLYGGYTNAYSGTSYSAPHVAGALALLLSAYPGLSAQDQQNALINSAVDLGTVGPDDIYGYGRLDVFAAYNWLASNPTPTPGPTNTATPLPTITSTPPATFTSTPVPTLTATSTSTSTPVPTSTNTPRPTSTSTPAAATKSHVGDLDRSSATSGTKWNATVTILVHNNNEQPVANATVTGKWTNGSSGTSSCTTNSSGICTVTKSGLSASTAKVTFSITGVSATSLTYTASSNHDPDGDSTGTSIVVSKP